MIGLVESPPGDLMYQPHDNPDQNSYQDGMAGDEVVKQYPIEIGRRGGPSTKSLRSSVHTLAGKPHRLNIGFCISSCKPSCDAIWYIIRKELPHQPLNLIREPIEAFEERVISGKPIKYQRDARRYHDDEMYTSLFYAEVVKEIPIAQRIVDLLVYILGNVWSVVQGSPIEPFVFVASRDYPYRRHDTRYEDYVSILRGHLQSLQNRAAILHPEAR